MNPRGPLGVSVIVPAYNAERYIAEALRSVIAQAYEPLQIIVVDDASGDRSAAVAESFSGVTVIRRASNGGIGAARNSGLARATQPLLAFLDADDIWPAGRLRLMLAGLEAAPELDAVFGQAVQFGDGRETSAPAPALVAGGMLMRRDAAERVGEFNENLKVGEFIDWWARAQELGIRHALLDAIVLRRRIHMTNTGILQAGARADYAKVLRAALQRRRAGS